VWMVTLRITEPPWYTTGMRGPAAASCTPYAGSRPMAKPTRGLNATRCGAAAADPHAKVNAISAASAATKAAPRSTLPARIRRPPYRTRTRTRAGWTALGAPARSVAIASRRLWKPGGLAGTPAEIASPAPRGPALTL